MKPCGDRIKWARGATKSEAKACLEVAENYPEECGVCLPDAYRWRGGPLCTHKVLLTRTGVPPHNSSSCATRIDFQVNSEGMDEYDACKFVAEEFPIECGDCGAPSCEGAFGQSCRASDRPSLPDWASHKLTRCPTDEVLVMGHSTNMGKHVCHECAEANCPIIAGSVNPGFNLAAQRLTAMLPSVSNRSFRVFNPSSVHHRGTMLIVARINNQTRCGGEGYIRSGTPSAGVSHVGICHLLQPDAPRSEWPVLQGCRILEIDFGALLDASTSVYSCPEDAIFAGAEDPRAFSFNGALYVYCKVALLMSRKKSWRMVDRMVLLKVDEGRRRAVALTVLYAARSDGSCADISRSDEKNWVFLRPDGAEHVLFAHSFSPVLIARCHVTTGCCMLERTLEAPQLEGYRGGSPAVALPDGRFWLILHRRVDLQSRGAEHALPPVYHHRMVVLDLEARDPSASVTLIGVPFRLPGSSGVSHSGGDDIQFVSGHHLSGPFSYTLYGVADCDAMMHRVRIDVDAHLKRGAARCPFAFKHSNNSRLPPTARTLRVEGPVLSTESFAEVNRHIMRALMPLTRPEQSEDSSMPLLHALDMSLFEPRVRYNAMCAADAPVRGSCLDWRGQRAVLASNRRNAASLGRAVLTIRNGWPPEFSPPPRGRLVVYFPWEFFHIPDEFVASMRAIPGEVWVPTTFVKDGLIRSGVPDPKVHVVPHGATALAMVDKESDTSARMAETTRSMRAKVSGVCGDDFIFLSFGGMLFRKAPTTILEAFALQFDPRDPACLVMTSTYGDYSTWRAILAHYELLRRIVWASRPPKVYRWPIPASRVRHILSEAHADVRLIARLRCDADDLCTGVCKRASGFDLEYGSQPNIRSLAPSNITADVEKQFELEVGECIYKTLNMSSSRSPHRRPKVLITAEILSTAEKEALFAMAGSLVHPSRGEGFGLIVAEAMAAGVPVITTDAGAVADFTSNSTAWLVPSALVPCYDVYPCGQNGSNWSIFSRAMAQPPLWLEVRAVELGATMRHVLEGGLTIID